MLGNNSCIRNQRSLCWDVVLACVPKGPFVGKKSCMRTYAEANICVLADDDDKPSTGVLAGLVVLVLALVVAIAVCIYTAQLVRFMNVRLQKRLCP